MIPAMRCCPFSRSSWLVLLALVGCRSTPAPQPVPLRGAAPAAIAVWPWAFGDGAAPTDTAVDGLDAAVRGRGYRVPSLAVTRELLRERAIGAASPPGTVELTTLGQALEADAVVVLDVLRWQCEGEPVRFAGWHLRWRLLSTRGLGEQWQHEHVGSWTQRDPSDPLRRLDEETPYVPIGGDRRRAFRSAGELLAQLHLDAMATLPLAR